MITEQIMTIYEEICIEQHISPFIDEKRIENLIRDGIYDIEHSVGFEIDFLKDLKAKSLLKNYVLYANHARLAEFKSLYQGEYIELQRDYYTHSRL